MRTVATTVPSKTRTRCVGALASVWLIFFVATGVRTAYAWEQQRKIPAEALVMRFQQETGNIAYSLATGKGFSSPLRRETGRTAWLPPVYPVLLAGIFRVFGVESLRAFFAAVGMNIVFSAGACFPIFYAGKRIGGLATGSAAAWMWALLPNAVIFPYEWIWDTSLTALLAAVLLWATLEVADSRRSRAWAGYGVLWGFALLTNPALGAALPLLAGWAAYASRGSARVRFERAALVAGCAILCCVPWTVRNYVVFHRFVPMRSNLGLELYVENNENYGEHPPVWPYQITREREIFRYFRMGEAAFMQEEMRKALRFMVANPRAEVRLTGGRMTAFWMGTASPIRDFRDADFFLRLVAVCSFGLAIGTVGGLALLAAKNDRYALPAAAIPIFVPLIYYVTHASLRYRHQIDPILVLPTAVAAIALAKRIAGIDAAP